MTRLRDIQTCWWPLLLGQAVALLLVVRTSLRHAPVARVRARARRLADGQVLVRPRELVVMMAAIGRRTPLLGRCLVQAIAAEAVLHASGDSARVVIGVARTRDGGLAAHAWVRTRDGEVVIGGDGHEAFVELRR